MLRIGIDIGGTSAKLGVVDDQGRVLDRTRVITGRDLPAPQLVQHLAAAVANLKDASQAKGVGVAAPGCRRADGEGVVNVTNLPHIDGFPLREEIERATGKPTVLDNDANAAAMGEYRFGAGKDAERLLVITIGTGIGGGMIVDGSVHRVAWQGLGDPGHVIVQRHGPLCGCGAHGCVEAIAAVPAILRRASELTDHDYTEIGDVVTSARDGDPATLQALNEAGEHQGIALVTLTHILTPTRILIGGGGMDAAGDLLMNPLRNTFEEHVQPFFARRLTLDRALLGNDAGLIGAAALVT